jgi:hypothetical protein
MSTIITDNPYTFTVADNMSINAVFEDDIVINLDYFPYLTSSVGRSITKTINGSSITLQYNRGSAETSSPAYTFLAWANTDTGAILSTSNPYTFTGSGTINITALTTDGTNTTSKTYGTRVKYAKTVYYKDGTSRAFTSDTGQSSLYVDHIYPTDSTKLTNTAYCLSCQTGPTSEGRYTYYGTVYVGNTWSMRSGYIAGYSEESSGYTIQPKDYFAQYACVPPFAFNFDTQCWNGTTTTHALRAKQLHFHAMNSSIYQKSYSGSLWIQGQDGYIIHYRPGAIGYDKNWIVNFWGLTDSQADNFSFIADLKY